MKMLIKEKSKESKLPPQQLYGLYAMDRLILKLSDSIYSDDLIVKGGFLLTTNLGLDSRATRDMDFTVRNIDLSEEIISELIDVIENNAENSREYFKVKGLKNIRNDFEYDGYSLTIDYFNDGTKIPISVDFTTGERLVSINEREKFKSIFTNEEYSLSSYTVEQVVVDKFYTFLAYGSHDDTNSRMKDYYDLYLINKLDKNIDYPLINKGLDEIMRQRDTFVKTNQYAEIIDYLHNSDYQRELWESYSKRTIYVNDLSFDDVIDQIQSLSNKLIKERMLSKEKKNEFER